MKFSALILVLATSFGCQKQEVANNSASESSETGTTSEGKDSIGNTGALSISENALAQSYPEGLSVTAFSSDTQDNDVLTTAGSLAIDYDSAALALNSQRIFECASPNNPSGCVPRCMNGQQPPACFVACPLNNPPPGCYHPCPQQSTDADRCFVPAPGSGSSGPTTSGTGSSDPAQAACLSEADITPAVIETIKTTGQQYNYDSGEALKKATSALFNDKNLLEGSVLATAPKIAAQQIKDRLAGKSDCVSDDLAESLKMIRDYGLTENLDGSGCYRPDWGIIDGKFAGTDEVCMVGFVRNETVTMGAYVTFAQRLMEAMICQAKADGMAAKELGVGQELDLGESLQTAVTLNDLKIKVATITREADIDSRKLFRTEFTVAISGAKDPDGKSFPFDLDVTLRHSPGEKSNDEYDGVLSISHLKPKQTVQQRKSLSLSYSKTTDQRGGRVKYQLRSGSFHQGYDMFDDTGVLDYNVGAVFTGSGDNSDGDYQAPTTSLALNSSQNDLAMAMKYVQYDGYPELGASKMSYWVNFGAMYREISRGFVFDTKLEDGRLVGCGYAGSVAPESSIAPDDSVKLSIRRAIREDKTLTPDAYWRPFICSKDNTKQADKSGYKVWRQCFARNDDGKYVIDAEKTEQDLIGFDWISTRDGSVTIRAPLPPPPPPPKR